MNPSNHVFTIAGKIKPYVRMTRKGKYSDPDAQEYMTNQEEIRYKIREQMQAFGIEPFEKDAKLAITAIVFREQARGDGDNILKAILDACNGVLYPDDRQFRKYDVVVCDRKDIVAVVKFKLCHFIGKDIQDQWSKLNA